MGTILDMLDITDILIPMDTILESVRLSQRPSLKLTLLFCMEDITDTILDMLDTMDIPILMDIMESVMLRPSLKLTLLFCMVDTMDTTLDMLDTMDMLDIPMLTGDKS